MPLQVAAELLCDIFAVEMVDEGSDVGGKEYRRPLYGADGSPARLTIKLKPFLFALDGRAGKSYEMHVQVYPRH